MHNAQLTLRDDDSTAHVQIGKAGDYERWDFDATDEIVDFYHAQVEAGNYGRSWANTDTKYVPVHVTNETKVVRVLHAMVLEKLYDEAHGSDCDDDE